MRHQSVENFWLFLVSLVRHPEVRHQSVGKKTPFFTKLKSHYNHLVEKLVDENIDSWFGSTPASKSLRRVTLLRALGET